MASFNSDQAPQAGGDINRRDFLGGAAAVAGGAIMGAPGMALAQATPKRGGIARLAFSDQNTASDTMDPRKESFIIDHARVYSVCNQLVRYSRKLEAEPELAASWEPSQGGTVWNFKLRQGITFHNGKTMTPEDVVYSLNLHRGQAESVIKAYFTAVKDIKVDGKDGVRVELSDPNADFPMYLGAGNSSIVPDGFTNFDNLVGTGPFKVKTFRPGQRFIGERNPNYWKSGLPYLDGFELFGIPQAQARLNALLAGDVHFITRVDPRQMQLIERSNNAKIAAAKSGRHLTVVMMMDREPFKDNLDLRLAIKYALDRDGILRDVRRGYGTIGNDHPVAPSDPYYCRDMPQRALDLDKAKFHYQKSGFSGPLTLHTSEVLGGEAVDIAVHLQQSAAKCGINIDVKREPTDGYYANIWMGRPFHISGFQPRPTADLMLSICHMSDAKWNEARFKSDKVDGLIRQGRSTIDPAKRKQIYCEAESLISNEGGTALPMFLDFLDGHSTKLHGFDPHPIGEAAGQRLTETLWLES
jgi:peptide/nickel transport system substrate-binding protein